ncbi:MAG TPA: hypothetical protein ENJ60_09360 [Aeromonadales bacterium]|nr:hypothetical protein [Aeromonadales bacterium]
MILFILLLLFFSISTLEASDKEWVDAETKSVGTYLYYGLYDPKYDTKEKVVDWYCNNMSPYRHTEWGYWQDCPSTTYYPEKIPYGKDNLYKYKFDWGVNDYTAFSYITVLEVLNCPSSHPNPIDFNFDGKADICLKPPVNFCPSIQTDGNPINCSTGQKIQSKLIYSGSGSDPLSYISYYSSPIINPDDQTLEGLFSYSQGAQRNDNHVMTISTEYNKNGGTVVRLSWGANKSRIYYGRNNAPLKDMLNKYGEITGGGDYYTYKTNTGQIYQFAFGKLTEKNLKSGFKHTYTYTPAGKLSTVTNHFGQQLHYYYNAQDQLEKLVTPDNKEYLFSYDANSNLIEISYPDETPLDTSDNPTTEYLFENPQLPKFLTGKINDKGTRIATWNYDIQGRALLSEHIGGLEKVEFDYSVENETRVKTYLTNTLSTDKIYRYQVVNGQKIIQSLEQLACADCTVGTWFYEYDSNNFLTKTTSPNGSITLFERESQHLISKTTEAFGTSSEKITTNNWSWIEPRLFSHKDGGLNVIYHYDSQGRVIGVDKWDTINPVVRSTTTTYNMAGLVATINNSRTDLSDVTAFTYDLNGNLSTITNPLGQVTTLENYDGSGRVGKITDPNGIISTLSYTPRGWIKTSTLNGASTQYDYFPTGAIKQVTTTNGLTLNYEYDAGERLIAIVDSLGNRLEYVRDVMGNVTNTQIKDPANVLKSAQSSVFNALGQLSQNLGNNGQSNVMTYDAEGNPVNTRNALNNASSSNYDALNRLIKSIDPNLGETTYSYNAHNEITSVTDAEGKVTQYQYNAFGDVTQLTSPDTGIRTYTYDSAGNMLSKTDARGLTVTFTYDALNRLLTQSYPDASENITYHYDDTTNGNKGIGHLTSVNDQTGSTSYFYNGFAQVTQETRIIGGKSYITHYNYDSKGQLTGIVYPDGRSLSYSFDGNGRVSSLTTSWQGVSKTLAANISYLPFGPMNGLTYGNGKLLTQSYDLDYRLTAKSVTGINQLSYSYDVTNNITTISNSTNSALNQSYLYDKLSRLIHATGNYGVLGYSFDKIGNRLTKVNNSQTDNYSYDASSHRLASVTGATTTNLSYDAVGNTLTKGNLSFTYNQQGRLKTATKTGMNASYQYNFKGERVSKTSNGQTTHYIYNGQGQLIAEADSTGAIQQEYIYLNGQRLATIVNGNIYYVHTNQLDAPIALTDETGTLKWQAHYTPFGKAIVDINNLTTASQNQRFPGQYFDSETGMHYNYFRDYDPEIGRYLESDPIGLEAGVSTYGYTLQNPINHTDPNGLTTIAGCANPVNAPACAAAGIRGSRAVNTTIKVIPRIIASSDSEKCDDNDDDECKKLNEDVNRAKKKVGKLGACKKGMSKFELMIRKRAWLKLASARSHRDQKCWSGGDIGHQQAQAAAWQNLGKCAGLLLK